MAVVNKEVETKMKFWSKRRFYDIAKVVFVLQILAVLVLFGFSFNKPATVKHPLYPGTKRLVKDIDRFLWSRFETASILDDPNLKLKDVKVGLPEGIPTSSRGENLTPMDFCPNKSPLLKGKYDLTKVEASQQSIKNFNPMVTTGGRYKPHDCRSLNKVAIIIPYWGDSVLLYRFLGHMHVVWQRQQLEYKVFVVKQETDTPQNRGRLLNAGFAIATNDGTYDCFVFHDVNLLLEDDGCTYTCPGLSHDKRTAPNHLAQVVDGRSYKAMRYDLDLCSPMPYQISSVTPLNGVAIFTREQFIALNGFSNSYWGKTYSENGDLYLRSWKENYELNYPQENKCIFRDTESKQGGDKVAISPLHYLLLKQSLHRQNSDGLKNVRYKILERNEQPLYTQLTLNIGRPSNGLEKLKSATDRWFRTTPNPTCFQSLAWLYHYLPKFNFTKL